MTKELQKAIMKKSLLKNKYNKNRNHKKWRLYVEKRNYSVTLLLKTKRSYFKNVNMQDITDPVKPSGLTLVIRDAIINRNNCRKRFYFFSTPFLG